jgi:hypothetical protein
MYNEEHDQPGYPWLYGILGWEEEDRHVLVYDRFDIWKVDPAGRNKPVSLTNGFGRKNRIQFNYVNLHRDEETIGRRDEIMLAAFNSNNKQRGFYYRQDAPSGEPFKNHHE